MTTTLKVGDSASITRSFLEQDVIDFALLTGDNNPVHLDEAYAAQTQFKHQIVHGMLVGSLFSTLLGAHLPGEGAIYMGQDLKFKVPVYLGMDVIATAEIIKIHESKPIVTLKTTCVDKDGNMLVIGEAVAFVPWLTRD